MKIGKRLTQLQSMVNGSYAHIWDCCCDHGLLGAALAKAHPASQIHFVDVVPELIAALNQKMNQYLAEHPNWRALCMDAGALPLGDFSGHQLVIIAGVGGDLMIDMITRLQNSHPTLALDFLLCPVHHQYALRQSLIEQGFKLKSEQLVVENHRFYEMLLVSSPYASQQANTPFTHDISATGSLIWQADNLEQQQICQQYLTKTLAHYQRIQRGRPEHVDPIIEAYQAVCI